jgi:AraC-like DNA-binding protein
LVADRISGFDRLADMDLRGSSSLLSLVHNYAMHVTLHTPDLDWHAAERLGANLGDLVCAMMAEAVGRTPLHMSEYKAAALVRVRHFVDQHLADPELKPATVAWALGLSPRYVNKLLQAEGTSLGRLIRHRRLERIAAALRDPALAARDISSIVLAHGFHDPSHASKAFRQHYGMSPRDYRHECAPFLLQQGPV